MFLLFLWSGKKCIHKNIYTSLNNVRTHIKIASNYEKIIWTKSTKQEAAKDCLFCNFTGNNQRKRFVFFFFSIWDLQCHARVDQHSTSMAFFIHLCAHLPSNYIMKQYICKKRKHVPIDSIVSRAIAAKWFIIIIIIAVLL